MGQPEVGVARSARSDSRGEYWRDHAIGFAGLANPIVWIPLLIAGLTALATWIYTHWAGVKAVIFEAWDGVKSIWESALTGPIEWVIAAFELMGSKLGMVWGDAETSQKASLERMHESAKSFWQKMLDEAKSYLQQFSDQIKVMVMLSPGDGIDNDSATDASQVITSAVLSITTAYTQTNDYIAIAAINDFTGGHYQYSGLIHTKRTDAFPVNITKAAELIVQSVSFYVDGTIPGTGDSRFDIYDVSLTVVYGDATTFDYRPTVVTVAPGSGIGIGGTPHTQGSQLTKTMRLMETRTVAP